MKTKGYKKSRVCIVIWKSYEKEVIKNDIKTTLTGHMMKQGAQNVDVYPDTNIENQEMVIS